MKESPNLNYIKQLSDGDLDFENQLIQVIKIELPQEIEQYNLAIKSKNYNTAADLVHKLKHKISALGLVVGYQTAVDYEVHLRQSNLELKIEFDTILKSILNFVDSY